MHRILAWALSVSLLLAGCKAGEGEPTKTICPSVSAPAAIATAPASVLDLSHWSLTLPVDASGAHSGTAATVTTSQLLAGYSSEWFQSTAGGGVTFFAPIQGATTAHTIYPRSELREMMDPSNAAVNWATTDTAEMVAFVTVWQVPAENGKVTVGEIVGYNGVDPDVNVLAKLVFEYNASNCAASLYTTTLPSPTASGSTANHQILSRSLRLGEAFPYSIRVENHAMTFTSGMATASEPIADAWDGTPLYFRAGAALWATGSSLTDGARVTFQQLQVTHGS